MRSVKAGQGRRNGVADHAGDGFDLIGGVEHVAVVERLKARRLAHGDAAELPNVGVAEAAVRNTVTSRRDRWCWPIRSHSGIDIVETAVLKPCIQPPMAGEREVSVRRTGQIRVGLPRFRMGNPLSVEFAQIARNVIQ